MLSSLHLLFPAMRKRLLVSLFSFRIFLLSKREIASARIKPTIFLSWNIKSLYLKLWVFFISLPSCWCLSSSLCATNSTDSPVSGKEPWHLLVWEEFYHHRLQRWWIFRRFVTERSLPKKMSQKLGIYLRLFFGSSLQLLLTRRAITHDFLRLIKRRHCKSFFHV